MQRLKKIPVKLRKNLRFQVLLALLKIEGEKSFSNLVVKEFLNSGNIREADKGLFTEIVYGCVARKLTLQFFLSKFVDKKMDEWVKQLLLLSIYQVTYLDKVPEFAIFHEAVEIARLYGNEGTGRFVNGVLRNVQRQGVPDFSEIKREKKRLSIQLSTPVWLIDALEKQYGRDQTIAICTSLFLPSKLSARVQTQKISREEVLKMLEKEGIQAEMSEISPDGIIARSTYLAKSKAFVEGDLTIQDETSMLVAPTLRLEKNAVVLDACAAPGGKTTHIASFLDEKLGGKVVALDIYPHKLALIEENVQRQQMEKRVETKLLDARDVGKTFQKETFDRILVDAPCSGLGLMRRKPDIKYQKEGTDFKALQKIQLEILESVAPTLKKGGFLTYSTCTIIQEENQDVIGLFLEKHPDFEQSPIIVSEKLKQAETGEMLQILPSMFQTDGFFISVLHKKITIS